MGYVHIYRQSGGVKPKLGLLLPLKLRVPGILIWSGSPIHIQVGVGLLTSLLNKSLLDPDWNCYPI
jgi:hypothetical protein